LSTEPRIELFLSRFAEGEWQGLVRPWLEMGRNELVRSIVVAPTLGQTHALKRRCLAESVPLLGVEFLTPAMARRKRGAPPDPGRDLQRLVLRSQIEARMGPLPQDDPSRLAWKSLLSDLDEALADFEELLRAGFRPEHFQWPELRQVFADMVSRMASMGYLLAPLEDEAAGLRPPDPRVRPVADRVLILAGGPECRGDFFSLAALARRTNSVSVGLALPEFTGTGEPGEAWIEMWQDLLGQEAKVADIPDPPRTCAAVAELWSGGAGSAADAGIIIGRSRSQEMEKVAQEVVDLLGSGSDNVAVVFPGADAAHEHLARILDARGVTFTDHLSACGTLPVETRIQHALVDFYEGGCRMEQLLDLWPLLRSLGLAQATLAEARAACEDLFDLSQSHAIDPHVAKLQASREADQREVGRVASLLLPVWPERLTPGEALGLFEAARDRLTAAAPPGWSALRDFARRAPEAMPSRAILEAIRAFLPRKAPLEGAPRRNGFAHVTLTTVRRAVGIAWSEVIFVESNHGVWPERREPSCWLGDEERTRLNSSGLRRFSLGLATSKERAAIEKRLFCSIARNARRRVFFSASLYDEQDPGAKRAPNGWLERVMWEGGLLPAKEDEDEDFGRLAEEAGRPHAPAVPTQPPTGWSEVWWRRRDASAPFDEHFLARGAALATQRLSASQIEDAIEDPATLWFGAVLGLRRVEWRPFERTRGKLMGTAVHGVLARAMRGSPQAGAFFQMPPRAESEERLASELAALRAGWPRNRYWDSFCLDVGWTARELLGLVYGLAGARYAAVEVPIPEGACVAAGEAGRVGVRGRIDLVLSDSPSWQAAKVDIVDFKTGGDASLSVQSMASHGASLQLGVYLAAAASLGAEGTVWMLRPGKRPSGIATADLERATAKLAVLGRHLSTGTCGALTPDRGEYGVRFEWPLACAPISRAVLGSKFEATFGISAELEEEGGDG
jgi:RecB family exonuclease